MQRRDFIRNLAGAALALSAGPVGRLMAEPPFPALGKEGWSGAAFERLQGEVFDFYAPTGIRRLVLNKVTLSRYPKVEHASLRFSGDNRTALKEGCYRCIHPALGEIQVYVVPGASVGGARLYRAIFGRLV